MQRFVFEQDDPLGEEFLKIRTEDGLQEDENSTQVFGKGSVLHFKVSPICESLVSQAQKLTSLEENMEALKRVTDSALVLVSRQVTLMLIASLRLVDAGRINSMPGKALMIPTPSSIHPLPALQCLSDAIASVMTDERSFGAGLQLMLSCSTHLCTAAVGGAESIQQAGRKWGCRLGHRLFFGRNDNSDAAVLARPSFEVSQRLVKILAKSAGKFVGTDSLTGGVVKLMDALAACLFSAKLEAEQRLWALEQLLRVFAETGASEGMKKAAAQKQTGRS